ncbi:MAG TPA: tetratricopeptide repeat protein, partial [Sphingopyxis terrae]|nr:tetratricopeptide repeat protein [Sphingopyxis terrae]
DKAYAEAVSLAQRAYDSGAETATATFAMARAQYYAGNCRGGVGIGDAAVRLNPYDADTAGFQGMFKIACDQPLEGIALLERSLALDASAPGVPAVTLAFVYSQQGRQDDALAVLDHMPSPSTMEPQYTMVRAIVFARQGKVDEARGLWRHLLDYTRQPQDAPPEKVLRQFMINPAVIGRASKALWESGVVAPQPVAR